MAFLDFFSPTKHCIPTQSGINWGHSSGHTCNYDAYLPIRAHIIHNNLVPIPLATPNPIPHIVRWSDGTVMQMIFEGTQAINGVIYPKQLSSHPNKNDLGFYLRNKMRLYNPNGTLSNAVVTLQDFANYGLRGVDLTLVNGVYHAHF